MAIFYFGYGSNMCTGRLRARVPSAVPLFCSKLTGHRLKFHKRSIDGSGKADAECTNDVDDFIWGVVFELDPAEKPSLDAAEGLGSGYLEKTIGVTSPNGELYSVSMYYADEIDSALKPYSWYLRFVVEGAKQQGLPSDYIAAVERIQSVHDTNRRRDMRNRQIKC